MRFGRRSIRQKNALHYLHYSTLAGKSAESAKQKEMRKVRILRNLTILTILSANFYISGNNRERIFYLSKMTKNDSKILLSFTKDAKETKVRVYKK